MQKKQGERLCDISYGLFVTAGILLPVLLSGKRGKVGMLRSLETLGMSYLACQGIKHTVSSRRPDRQDDHSFPSGHTMNTMALATIVASVQPKQAPLWYLSSALIGLWRIGLRRHRPRDVFFGSLMGFLLARFQLSRRRGLLFGWVKHLAAHKQ